MPNCPKSNPDCQKSKKELEVARLQAACENAKSNSKNKAKACRLLAQKEQEELKDSEKRKLERIVAPEKIRGALKAIRGALNRLKDSAHQKVLKRLGITLESENYYLAIAAKESNLEPYSFVNGKGLFCIRTDPGNDLAEIKAIFGETMNSSQIHRPPRATKNKKEELREIRELETCMQNNALAGILHWHICKDVSRRNKNLQIPKEDQDRAAAFIHEMGIDGFDNLWRSIGAKNFNDFAIKVSAKLAQGFPGNFVIPRGGKDVFEDDVFKVNYTSYIYTSNQKFNGTILIGHYNYKVSKLVKILRSSEIVQSLARKQPVATYETTKESYRLQDIAEKLLVRCGYGYANNYCQKNEIPNSRKVKLLIEIIVEYNIQKNNPSFKEPAFDEERIESLKNGAKVFLPAKEYLEKALAKAHATAKNEGEPIKPGKVPLYGGPDAAKLERWGNEPLVAPKVPPRIVIPKFRGEYLDPDFETSHGHMPKDATQGIVIHGTEGTQYPWLYEDQNIHYILKRNGTLELIHNPNIAVSHCGTMAQKPRKRALWNGEQSPSYHFVGIEVENLSLASLIRNGKVAIKVGKDAKISKVGSRYFTSTPPTQAAKDEAWRQAKRERDFTNEQYDSLKTWIAYIGAQKGLKKKDVLTHHMVATNGDVRGRKSDPPVFNWARVGLPNNYLRVDPEVATGRLKANLNEAERIRSTDGLKMRKHNGKYEIFPSDGKDGSSFHYYFSAPDRFGGDATMMDGVKAADKIWHNRNKKHSKNKKTN
jgi:hypothetical protein